MQTIKEIEAQQAALKEQMAALEAQKEEARKAAIAEVKDEILAKMAAHNMKAEDLGFISPKVKKEKKVKKDKAEVEATPSADTSSEA